MRAWKEECASGERNASTHTDRVRACMREQTLVVRQRAHNKNSANLLEAAQDVLSSAGLSSTHARQGQLDMVSHLMHDLSLVCVCMCALVVVPVSVSENVLISLVIFEST